MISRRLPREVLKVTEVARDPQPRGGAADRVGLLLSVVYVSVLVAFAVRFMWAPIFRTWFFNADEYVVAAEVIRFAQLDFRQRFFDMPGTPLMLLASAVWGIVYAAHCTLGTFPWERGIGEFTFEHLPALFVVIRGFTLFFFCLSMILLFWLTAWLTNKAAAWVAALILAMSPTYSVVSASIRVESLAISFTLAGLLSLVYALDRPHAPGEHPHRRRWGMFDMVFMAGVFAGLGAATRLHTITASLPVMALVLMLWPPREKDAADYPRWVKIFAGVAAAAVAAAQWLLMVTWRVALEPRPHAYRLLQTVVIGVGCALVAGFVLYLVPRTRRLLIRIVSPDLIRLLIGCGAGVLLGMPTIIRQYEFLLGSMEFYRTGYVDFARAGWPFWKNVQWYATLYLGVVAPDTWVRVLLAVGAAVVLLTRNRRVAPFLVGAILFFVSKPLSLLAAPHHVLPWLPFFAIVCGYPVGLLFDLLARRVPYGKGVASASLAIGFTMLALSVTPGPKAVAAGEAGIEERLGNIVLATNWIKHHAAPDATIAVRYYCFNADIAYVWMRSLGVPVPPAVFDSRTFEIWWGTASQLKGRAGYVCLTPLDLALTEDVERRSPGDGVDPVTDPRLGRVQSFGTGNNEIILFRFDFR